MTKKGIMFLSNELFEGGSEEIILSLASYLQQKYNTFVASLNYGPILEKFKANNIKIINVKGYDLKGKIKSIKQAIYNFDIEFVFCNYIHIGHFLLPEGVKTIEIVHAPYPWLLGDPLYTKALIKCSKIICVSQHVYNFMKKNFKNITGKMSVIENGINENKFKPTISKEEVKKKYNIPLDCTVIGNIGRICPEKGLKRLIEIAAILNKKYKNTYCVIVGDYNRYPDFYQEVKEIIKNNNINNIIFTGFTSNVANMLQIFDIFVFPSYHEEGLQLALVEALKMGLPIVTTSMGVVKFDKDIKDGISGYIIEDYDPMLFSDKISLLINNQGLRKEMGKYNYRVFAKKYTDEEMGRHYQQLIDNLSVSN